MDGPYRLTTRKTSKEKIIGHWYYVGIWNPTKKDGGYQERRNNLKQNPYNYWPT